MDWTQVYLQNLNQMSQMLNQMNQNQNFNNAMDQIYFMANNNSPQTFK